MPFLSYEECLKLSEQNRLDIKKSIESGEYGGRFCSMYESGTGNRFYVVAATKTDEDFYYVVINPQREFEFLSCVGRIYPIEKGKEGLDFSVLNYLIKHEPESIVTRVRNFLKECKGDTPISKINIAGKLYRV